MSVKRRALVLEQDAPRQQIEVWRSTDTDLYRYRCSKLDMELSREELDERSERPDLQLIVVQYVEEPIPDWSRER